MAVGVRTVGARKAIRELRSLDAGPAVARVHRRHAVAIQDDARARMAGEPIPKRRSAIGRRAGQTKASIILAYRRHHWIAGGEFGSHAYRQFRRFRGTGYMVGPAIERRLPIMADSYADEVLDEIAGAL